MIPKTQERLQPEARSPRPEALGLKPKAWSPRPEAQARQEDTYMKTHEINEINEINSETVHVVQTEARKPEARLRGDWGRMPEARARPKPEQSRKSKAKPEIPENIEINGINAINYLSVYNLDPENRQGRYMPLKTIHLTRI